MTRKRIYGFDYRQPNAFYVTICTFARSGIRGSIEDTSVVLSPIGDESGMLVCNPNTSREYRARCIHSDAESRAWHIVDNGVIR